MAFVVTKDEFLGFSPS